MNTKKIVDCTARGPLKNFTKPSEERREPVVANDPTEMMRLKKAQEAARKAAAKQNPDATPEDLEDATKPSDKAVVTTTKKKGAAK